MDYKEVHDKFLTAAVHFDLDVYISKQYVLQCLTTAIKNNNLDVEQLSVRNCNFLIREVEKILVSMEQDLNMTLNQLVSDFIDKEDAN